MFEPPPSSRIGTFSLRQRRTRAASSSTELGSAKNSAGPPSLQPRPLGQRLLLPDDFFEAANQRHGGEVSLDE